MKKKFLLLRFSSIGDIVLTTPVIRCLKKQYPNAEVHFATKKQFKTLVENNPYIDKFFLLEDSLNSFIKDLQSEQYDFVIDLHNNLRTRIIKLALKKNPFSDLGIRSFNKLNFRKWLLVKFKKNFMPIVHIVDRYMDTLEDFGITNDKKGLDYFIPERDEVPLDWLPASHQKGYVTYAIGGQHETKKLPLHKMVELCQQIKQPIILLGGKEDFENGEKLIAQSLKLKAQSIFNACGKFNLNQSASVIKQSSQVYTHDTGLMHIAAAFKKNIVSIWGNTVPEFGMYPYMTNFVVWENKDLNCRPCSKIGYDKCPLGHFKCMNEIRFNE